MTIRILMAGGTGLVGRLLTARLAERPDVELVSLVRRTGGGPERQVDFEALAREPAATAGPGPWDVGVSCLGTTIRAAGSRPAFTRVDHDYVLALATAARSGGARQFVLVSSAGAGGRGFYLRVKGEVEAAVRELGFERLDIVRPGLLLGERDEHRPGERIAQLLAPLLNPLLRGPLGPYASVPAMAVAETMARRVGAPGAGVFVTEGRDLVQKN